MLRESATRIDLRQRLKQGGRLEEENGDGTLRHPQTVLVILERERSFRSHINRSKVPSLSSRGDFGIQDAACDPFIRHSLLRAGDVLSREIRTTSAK